MARINWKGSAPYEYILGKETGEKIYTLMEYLGVNKKHEALRFAVDFACKELIEEPFTPSAEPERKWIPVTEALPNNEEYDWVLGQIRETDSGYLWIPRQVEYRESKDDWYEDSIGWLKENPDHAFEVIAWMPLPEPWRGDNDLPLGNSEKN